jgi:hypothetical protein
MEELMEQHEIRPRTAFGITFIPSMAGAVTLGVWFK